MTPIRIQRKRTKGWKMPANTVYVGRGTKWGNPFEVGAMATVVVKNKRNKLRPPQEQHMLLNNDMAVLLYRERVQNAIAAGLLNISELHGKNLACFCPLEKPCHADILLKLANGEK